MQRMAALIRKTENDYIGRRPEKHIYKSYLHISVSEAATELFVDNRSGSIALSGMPTKK